MTLSLICHPDFVAERIQAIEIDVEWNLDRFLKLTYRVFGDINALELLDKVSPKRTDYLWQQTCFEAFIGAKGEKTYLEFNLSPSTEWAVYAFEDHRRGMRNPDLQSDPEIELDITEEELRLTAKLDLNGLPCMDAVQLELSATAVIEEIDGQKSLWALAHPSGNPDFHNRGCFVHLLEGAASQ